MPELTPERWREIAPHLDRVLEKPEPDRAVYLAEIRTRDPELAAELEALLDERLGASRDRFLEGSPSTIPSASIAGQVFGTYTLDALIGQGGMGNVWLAHRSDGRFESRAALKLLNASLVGRSGEERFRREGQVLARLADPHIARLIDAGVAASGQPYLVLEYVEGRPIDEYCDAEGLRVERRLELFLEVLEAVAHAHANLIVHRDIKPSNVLVDRGGHVKLLDFGIAKLLEGEGEGGAATALTREAGRALTPEFAAPEQITAGVVTTATDVYALGTLLYLLLTGRHPAGEALRSPAELIRWTLETEPDRPSVAVSPGRRRGAAETDDVAAARSATPEALRRKLRGDLDTIVSRALKKHPAERYPSVAALADDLRRFLRHEPIAARPDTLGYRTARFVQRHRTGVAAVALVLLAAVAGSVAVLRESREARRQRDAARGELARATAANEFLGFLLSTAAPAGRMLSQQALLEQGQALADKQFADNPPLHAEILATIGQQYLDAENWPRAIPVLERATRIAPDAGLRSRTLCALALAQMATGNVDAAKATIARGMATLPEGSQYALERAACLCRQSEFGYFTDEGAPMTQNARAALAVLDAAPVGSTVERLNAMGDLAYGYYLSRENARADAAYAELMASLEKTGRGRTTAAADALNNWALVHFVGDIVRAEPLMRRSLELRRSIEGPDVTPTIVFDYASVLSRLARYDEAAPLFEETIRTAQKRQEGRIEADAIMELSDLDTERGDLRRAAADLARIDPSTFRSPVFNIQRQAHFAYSEGIQALVRGNAVLARDRLAKSTLLFRKSTARNNLTVFVLIALARAELATGHTEAAMAAAREALEISKSFVAEGTPSYLVGHSLEELGEIELVAGDRTAARTTLASAVDQLSRSLGPEHPAVRRARRLADRAGA
jgi:serine/threonine protein kinase